MHKQSRRQHRKQSKWLIKWSIVLTIVGGMFAIGLTTGIATAGASSSLSTRTYPSTIASVAPIGAPAIVPHLDARSTGPTSTAPAFSTADVVQYVKTHPIWRNIASCATPTAVRVEFLTSQQVTSLLSGESTGMPDGALLCYVQMRGTFTFAGSSGKTVTYHTGYEVFDAHTGNLLMAGGF